MTDTEKFYQTIADLESGKVRVAEKVNGEWKVNSWVKEVILSGFRLGKLTDMTQGQFSFFDKDTIPAKAAMAAMGLIENELRLPLVPSQQSTYDLMVDTIKQIGLI